MVPHRHFITDTTYGFDLYIGTFQFFPEVVNMYVDRPRFTVEIVSPYRLQ